MNGPFTARERVWQLWVLRVCIAGVLLFASASKAYDLIQTPTRGSLIVGSWKWTLILIEWEAILGCWILGSRAQSFWWPAILTYCGFAVVSLGKVLLGATSCGCFGGLLVPPWLTLGLDSLIIGALIWMRQGGYLATRQPPESPNRRSMRHGLAFSALAFGLGAVTATAVILRIPAEITEEGDILGDGKLVVLEPQEWVGKRLPLLEYMEVDVDLSAGPWTILLVHHGCPKCMDVVSVFGQMADSGMLSAVRLVLVDLDRSGRKISPSHCWVTATLSHEREWFTETPIEINTEDGVVTNVRLPDALERALAGAG